MSRTSASSEKKTAVVTGSAGFIGYHLASRLLADGWQVVGIDEINDYYDPSLKTARNERLLANKGYRFHLGDLAVPGFFSSTLASLRRTEGGAGFTAVFHLAAQAGVRQSFETPSIYVRRNIDATFQVLDGIQRLEKKPHLYFASSSSVYGNSPRIPFREDDPADQPVSFYGATKRACELLIRAYHEQFALRSTILRFFTVYGPWGRPDMSIYLFTRKILQDQPIELFDSGRMTRDFTFIDDVIESVARLAAKQADLPGFEILNVGGSNPRPLMDFVHAIDAACATGRPLRSKNLPAQTGDVRSTHADCTRLESLIGFRPQTPIEEGTRRFVKWYLDYHR